MHASSVIILYFLYGESGKMTGSSMFIEPISQIALLCIYIIIYRLICTMRLPDDVRQASGIWFSTLCPYDVHD